MTGQLGSVSKHSDGIADVSLARPPQIGIDHAVWSSYWLLVSVETWSFRI